MSFLNTIKHGLASGTKAVGAGAKGVGGVIRDLAAPTEASPPAEGAPVAPAQDVPSKGFSLPELDENDPDYVHRKAVHDAILTLEKQWMDANPQIDYEGHYRQLQAEMKKAPSERDWGPLYKFGVALGTQNPNEPYTPNVGLANMNDKAAADLASRKQDFEDTLSLKKEALSGHIRQLLDEGKFRQALAQLNASEQLNITKQRQEHEFRTDEESAKITSREKIAKLHADALLERESRHNEYLREQAGKLRLSPSDKAAMDAEYKDLDGQITSLRKQVSDGMLDADSADDAIMDVRRQRDRLRDKYEARELVEGAGSQPRPKTAAATPSPGMQPNANDPWFSK
jgi:hypothetical protein